MKFKLSTLALAVSISLLTACGGGSGGGNTVITPPPVVGPVTPPGTGTGGNTWKVESSQLVNFGSFDTKTTTFWNKEGFVVTQVIGSGDVNGDGYEDLVVGSYVNFGEPIKPVILFFNKLTFKFEPNNDVQKELSTMIWPRKVVIEDFNGGGRNDIFLADHGEENSAHKGAQNQLILNTISGYQNATNLLPQIKDFSHSVAVADFDKNGKNDVLVVNSPFIKNLDGTNTNDSYVLFNTGTSNLIKGQLTVDDKSAINFNQAEFPGIAYHASHAEDLNNDNIADIILGGDDTLVILESTTVGSYKKVKTFQVSDQFKKNYPGEYFPYSYIVTYDIDQDGKKEIIASSAHQTPVNWDWLGNYFHVYEKNSLGEWTDSTDKFFPTQDQSQDKKSWCYKIYIIDVNYDGKNDTVCSGLESMNNVNNVVWLNIDGKFIRQPQTAYNSINLTGIFPVKLGNEKYMIGQAGMGQYYGWKLN